MSFAGFAGRARPDPKKLAASAILALLAAAPTPAPAQTGGTSLGRGASVSSLQCLSRCEDPGGIRSGGLLRVTGRNLAAVRTVNFLGSAGTRDDAVAPATRRRDRSVDVRVPAGAYSGRVSVTGADGVTSARSRMILRVVRPEPADQPAVVGGPVEAQLASRTVFFAARQPATLNYRLRSGGPQAVFIDLVNAATGVSVGSWSPGTVAPGVAQSVSWDGRSGARAAPEGRYQFRIFVGAQASLRSERTAAAASATPSVADSFRFLPHMFPLRGRHDFGGAGAGFGSGRAGHSHQGHDVFAACGTPVVAARGGTVQVTAYHSAAGHYLVIDGAGIGVDYFYAHLRDAPLVRRGDRVFTGQLVGYNGDSGNARGCHVHFELWREPGWYEGGAPFNPLPWLKVWDRGS